MSEDHELVSDEWIVVFYPQTSAVRLHPTLEAARQHLSRTGFAINVHKSPMDFQKRYDHATLVKFWKELCKTANWRWPKYAMGPRLTEADLDPPDLGTEAFSKELWNLIQRVGDRVIRLSVAQTKSKDHYELDLKKLRALVEDPTFKDKYPKQCRVIIARMSKYESPYQLEEELQRMMRNLVASAELRTKQDSWLIFQYYRKQLMDDGLFARGKELATEVETEEEEMYG